MTPRFDTPAVAPALYKAMAGVEMQVQRGPLAKPLLELVKMRASQINGCAFCLDMHARDARAGGETEQRLYLLNAWRESPLFDARERAALAWTEALTLVSTTHAPDAVYEEVLAQFGLEEAVTLTFAIMTINAWNRLAIAGRYLHAMPEKAAA